MPTWRPVVRIDLKPPRARISYFDGVERHREWYCLVHPEKGWTKRPCAHGTHRLWPRHTAFTPGVLEDVIDAVKRDPSTP